MIMTAMDNGAILNNLRVLGALEPNQKLISDKTTHKLTLDERTWFTAIRRYKYGFAPESVERTYKVALELLREASYNEVPEKQLQEAQAINKLMIKSFEGVLTLIETYRKNGNENFMRDLQNIQKKYFADYQDLPQDKIKGIPLAPPPPARKARAAGDRQGALTRVKNMSKATFSVTELDLKTRKLNPTGIVLKAEDVAIPDVARVAPIPKTYIPKISIPRPLSVKAQAVHEALKIARKSRSNGDATAMIASCVAQKAKGLSHEDLQKRIEKLEAKKAPSIDLSLFNINMLSKKEENVEDFYQDWSGPEKREEVLEVRKSSLRKPLLSEERGEPLRIQPEVLPVLRKRLKSMRRNMSETEFTG